MAEPLVLEQVDYTTGDSIETCRWVRCDFCNGSIIDSEWCKYSMNENDWPTLYRLQCGTVVCSNCLEKGGIE